MKKSIFYFASFIFLCSFFIKCKKETSTNNPNNNVDSASVTVINGYGSGKYKVGDTVHIWSTALAQNEVFNTWSGYDNFFSNLGEWHNSFIMPSHDVTVTGSTTSITPFTLKYEKIKCKSILKNVYYYFPISHKGVVFLLHGTSGSAANLVGNYEWKLMIKDLVSNGYAVVITEAEEVSLNSDTNGDGKIRWATFPADSINNVDYANIKALTDTFNKRAYTNNSIPQFSIGMSNGGSFSAALSALYRFKSGVSYCASSSALVFANSVTPFQFCMAKFDDNAEVGAQGNADASTYAQTLLSRGICSKYFINNHSPIYKERFARSGDISIAVSTNIVNELKANAWIDSKNYLKASAETIVDAVQLTPSNYPVLVGLPVLQQLYVANEIDAMFAAHQFYSDFNKTTISFLNHQCF